MVLCGEPLRGWVGKRVTPPVLFLGIVILSYGLWIPWMGLFGNDLAYLYYYNLLRWYGLSAGANRLWKETGAVRLKNASALEGMLAELGCQS